MALISSELFDKLGGITISRRDRNLIYAVLVLAGSAVGYMIYSGKDDELRRIAMNGMLWLIAALVLIFVAAGAVKRGQAGAAVKVSLPAPPPVEINLGAPVTAAPGGAVAEDVKEVKADVKVVRADVKDVKEQTKKDAAVAVGAVVNEIKKEVVKAVKASKK